eukprot:g183.t1
MGTEPPSYDFRQLLSLKPGASSSSPEFFGPITVARVPGKHRGLVCARAVRRGELLFANRALAVAETRSLPEVTCQKLRSCSEWDFGAFFLLSDGLHTPHELPKLPQVPREEVENMDQRARDVKKERVKAILSANAHELDTSGGQLSAIFLVASLVNHSCRPSAARVFLGDMMFVRAARDLNAGDEITDGYISVLQPALERRRAIRERYGFELCEDRILVEEHLFSKAAVTELLEKIDNANSLEDFSEILEETQRFVSRQLRSLSDCTAESATCVTAAQRLGCGLERLLLGGLVMPVQVGMATILSHMGRHAEAAKGYCRCCWLMEELAPHNAYHAKWAVEALVEAAKASLPLGDYAAYAQHVLNGHCGPGPEGLSGPALCRGAVSRPLFDFMVVQRIWNFVSRHRKKLIFTGIVAGGVYYYVKVKLPKIQADLFDSLLKELTEGASASNGQVEEQQRRVSFQKHQEVSDSYARKGLQNFLVRLQGCFKIDQCQAKVKAASDREQKLAALKELQVECLSMVASAAYSLYVILLLHRVQFNIAGREAISSKTGEIAQDGAESAAMQELIASTDYFLEKGAAMIVTATRSAVQAASLQPDAPVSTESLTSFFKEVFEKLEKERSNRSSFGMNRMDRRKTR